MVHKRKKNSDGQQQFDFCEVCRLNHNHGRRHNFFPSHKSSLSALLSRFQSKLSDIRFFLRTPMRLRPEHAHQNRMWCVFCNCDVVELDSSFACGNAIEHMVSGEHWKRVKEFMWKHGGGMDRVDSFRITEVDYAKWEKKCNSLKTESVKAESVRPVVGPSKRMRELRRPVRVYLLYQQLLHPYAICMWPFKQEIHRVSWIISIVPVLELMNAHHMCILMKAL